MRSSLERGPRPRPGLQRIRYRWPDLLDGAPPRQHRDAAYAVYHATEVEDDVRLVHTTLVEVMDRDGSAWLRADARVSVQRRTLLERIDRARAAGAERTHRQQRALGRFLAAQNAWARRLPGTRAAWLMARLVHAEGKLGLAVIAFAHHVAMAAVQVPDLFVSAWLRTEAHLATRLGRRGLWASMLHPDQLDAEQKGALLFLSTATMALTVLVLNSVFALAWPEAASVYRGVLGNALAQLASVFGVPIVVEPLLVLAVLGMGPVLGLAGFVTGKFVGAWMMYLAGDALHRRLERREGRTRRMMEWLHRNADKYGFVILVLDNALPLMPDQVLYVFAVSGMRFRSWFGGVVLGTAIKFAVIVAGIYLVGPERAGAWFAHPFG